MNGQQLTLDGYFIEAATTAKLEGIAAAAEGATSLDEQVVFDAVGCRAPGEIVTVNTLREELDAAQVPAGARSPKLRAACLAGLLEPYMIDVAGQRVQASVPSTGKSAKGAGVKVYRRTASVWAPRRFAVVS